MKQGDVFKRQLLGLFVVGLLLVTGACASAPGSTLGAATTPVASPTSASDIDTTEDFVNAVAKVMPSVVKVEITFGPQGAPGDPQAKGGAGTGWVIRQDGLIVTNNHVVDGAQTITVILPDGTKYTPTSVKTDAAKDLAVLRIAATNLPAVVTGDSSKLKLGQPVAALGNALNMGVRVTTGVVSQLNVPISTGNEMLKGLIETDAAINPGNSGGVLINVSGEVIGIPNSKLEDPNLDVENFGYAININEAMPVINSLISQMP
jgi:S1-C subfamily serine protease